MKPSNKHEQWREEVSMYVVSNTLVIGLRKHNDGAREKE
jgi:hypothetical protein